MASYLYTEAVELFHINLPELVKTIGYLGVMGIIFAESGLLVGFFLPGDSLLFTAGLLASQGYLHIAWLIGLTFIAAVVGDNVGYAFGKKVGPRIFSREDSRFFHKDNLRKAQEFYDAHGPGTIVLARFMPFVRTFAPILAGVGTMKYQTFFTYNLLGGALWTIGLNLAGYYLGKVIPGVDRYLLPIVVLIVLVSVAPSFIKWLKTRRGAGS